MVSFYAGACGTGNPNFPKSPEEPQFAPLNQLSRRQGDVELSILALELGADFVRNFNHLFAQLLRDLRRFRGQNVVFDIGLRIINDQHTVAVHGRHVLADSTGVNAGFVTITSGIACRDEPKERMRLDHLSAILFNHERPTFEKIVETREFTGIDQIRFIENEDVTERHGLGERAVNPLHRRGFAGFFTHQGMVADQVLKLQTAAGGNRLHGPVEPGGDFRNDARLARTRRAGEKERIPARGLKEHQDVSEKFLAELVVRIGGRYVGAVAGSVGDQSDVLSPGDAERVADRISFGLWCVVHGLSPRPEPKRQTQSPWAKSAQRVKRK